MNGQMGGGGGGGGGDKKDNYDCSIMTTCHHSPVLHYPC